MVPMVLAVLVEKKGGTAIYSAMANYPMLMMSIYGDCNKRRKMYRTHSLTILNFILTALSDKNIKEKYKRRISHIRH